MRFAYGALWNAKRPKAFCRLTFRVAPCPQAPRLRQPGRVAKEERQLRAGRRREDAVLRASCASPSTLPPHFRHPWIGGESRPVEVDLGPGELAEREGAARADADPPRLILERKGLGEGCALEHGAAGAALGVANRSSERKSRTPNLLRRRLLVVYVAPCDRGYEDV